MLPLGARLRSLYAAIVGERLSVRAIAGGWALGMFVGCAIPFGFQLLVSVPLAVLFRLSKTGATLGTLVTNPVTIWFIYPVQTWAVYTLLFGGGDRAEMPVEWTFRNVMAMSGPLVASFFLGGLALALVLTPVTYVTVRYVVARHRRLEARRNLLKR